MGRITELTLAKVKLRSRGIHSLEVGFSESHGLLLEPGHAVLPCLALPCGVRPDSLRLVPVKCMST